MTRPNFYFAMVPCPVDSFGRRVVPSNAIMHGNDPAMLTVAARERECARREDSISARERDLLVLADAVQQQENEVKAAEDEARAAVIADLIRKMDAFSARLDAYEAELNKDPDDDEVILPPDLRRSQELAPPGELATDSGDLQASEGRDHSRSEEEEEHLLHPEDDDAKGDLPAELTEPPLGTHPELSAAREPEADIPASTSMW
jgi:hypothetical protein